jgi:hypothetical protein
MTTPRLARQHGYFTGRVGNIVARAASTTSAGSSAPNADAAPGGRRHQRAQVPQIGREQQAALAEMKALLHADKSQNRP